MQDFSSASGADGARQPEQGPAFAHSAPGSGDSRADWGRLTHLPVEVSVRLAEKKIELAQLLSLTPGSLITFNKPCEDLLDLYVNNRPFCRGEAVKIGEKFGLKINVLGAAPARQTRVITE